MISVTIGTPHKRNLTPEYVLSLIDLLSHINGKIRGRVLLYQSSIISKARNSIAFQSESDYLLFIDSDTVFSEEVLDQLLAHDKDIVGAIQHCKSYPYKPSVYNLNERNRFTGIFDVPDKLFKCDGIGFGIVLIKRKVFDAFTDDVIKKIGYPFNFYEREDDKIEEGEDLGFCRRVKELGFEIWCDPNIDIGHMHTVVVNPSHFKMAKKLNKEKNEA